MTFAVLALVLAFGWAAATGSFSLLNLLFGAVVAVLALLVVAFVVHHLDDVGVALLITAVSFAISIPVLLLARRRCVRDERKATSADAC